MAERQNTKNQIPSNALADLNDNSMSFDEFCNSTAQFVLNRFGEPYKPLKQILKELQTSIDNIEKGAFLSLNGGTVTGSTNFTNGLKSKNSEVITTAGGTVSGATDFTGTLKNKGIDVLKVGDAGLAGQAKYALSQATKIDLSGLYRYDDKAAGMEFPAGFSKYGVFSKISWTPTTGRAVFIMHDIQSTRVAVGRVADDGNIDVKEIITTANVANHQNGIGFGQSWVNVTSSRFGEAIYTNNTGKPIAVSITMNDQNVNNNDRTFLYVDDVIVAEITNVSNYNTKSQLFAIVPDKSTYQIKREWTSLFVVRWVELR